MCEFKIIRKNDDTQIGEDILVLNYTKDNELLFKDVLGMGDKLESALILDVNTLNKTCIVLEHPLIKDFITLMISVNDQKATKEEIENFQKELEKLKNNL